MAGMDWFRWHHGSVNDPKFQLVARKAGASVAEVLAVWACLLEAASQSEERGNVGSVDFEAMDCALGLDEGRSQAIYERMTERDLVTSGGVVASWEKRQPKREREDEKSTERVKAFRERQRQEAPGNASETPCNATETPETPREEKSREEKTVANATEGEPRKRATAPEGVPAELWADYLEVRKAKRAGPITGTVLTGLRREAGKAGVDLAEAVKACCEYGWQGFSAQWFAERQAKAASGRARGESFAEQSARMARERVAQFAPGVAAKDPSINVIEVFDVPAIASR